MHKIFSLMRGFVFYVFKCEGDGRSSGLCFSFGDGREYGTGHGDGYGNFHSTNEVQYESGDGISFNYGTGYGNGESASKILLIEEANYE